MHAARVTNQGGDLEFAKATQTPAKAVIGLLSAALSEDGAAVVPHKSCRVLKLNSRNIRRRRSMQAAVDLVEMAAFEREQRAKETSLEAHRACLVSYWKFLQTA